MQQTYTTKNYLPLSYMVMQREIKLPKRDVAKAICIAICNQTGIDYTQLCGTSRKSPVKEIRHIFFYLARKHDYKLSFTDLCRFLNRDSHATAIHSVKTCNNLMSVDRVYKKMVISIENEYLKLIK